MTIDDTEIPPTQDQARPKFSIWDVVLTVVVGVIVGVVVTAIVLGPFFATQDVSTVIGFSVGSSLIYATLLLTVYVLIVQRRNVTWQELGLRSSGKRYVLQTIGLTFLVLFVNGLVMTLVAEFGDPPTVNEQVSIAEDVSLSNAEVLWLAFSLIIAAPIVEEIVFRGLLFPSLRARWRFAPAAVVSAVIFALAHATLTLIPTLFILGLVLAWLKEHYDSLWPPILLHGLNNGIAVLILVAITTT